MFQKRHIDDVDSQVIKDWQLEEFKKRRIFEIKSRQILKEVIVYLVFLVFLYSVSFSNVSSSAKIYNKLFINTFVQQQDKYEIGLRKVYF